MRSTLAITAALAFWTGSISFAQDVAPAPPEDLPPPTPEVAPPPEIVVPTDPGKLPLPSRDPVRVDGNSKGAKHLKIGTIVSGDVPLYSRVRIEDRRDIHPRAVPYIIAVMDPHEGPWHPHNKIRKYLRGGTPDDPPIPVVFVQVLLPPEAIASMRVKREEIDFEWGRYEVNIDSEDGVVTIDYDD